MIDVGLKPLLLFPVQPYLSQNIQIYHVIDSILHQIGPAELINTTFSVSEEFCRAIYRLKRVGLITRAIEVADFKAAAKTVRVNGFMASVFDEAYLAEIHAKVVLLRNDRYAVSVVTSQNQTRGNRYECGIITTDATAYAFLENAVRDIIRCRAASIFKSSQFMANPDSTSQQAPQINILPVPSDMKFDLGLGYYTPQQLDLVGEYAADLMRPSDIAVLLCVDPDILLADIRNRSTEVSFRYHRAKAETTLLMHKKERELATAGSAAAVENLHQFQSQMTSEE